MLHISNINNVSCYILCISGFSSPVNSRMSSARSSTSLVVSVKMSTNWHIFFIAKSRHRKALRWGRRKEKTPRRDEVSGTATEVLIGQGRPLFHCEKSLSQTSQSILHFFRPHSTIRRDLSIDSTSKSIERVEYRKRQSRVLLRFAFRWKKYLSMDT